jgi:CDGSH-type Zn-finger protein
MSSRPITIVACPNGPLLVRGDAQLTTADGEPIDRHGRNTVALCRCGMSGIKPFCDGSHKTVGFTTEPRDPESPTD